MIIKKVELETVIGPTSALPENTLPEVAFAGRSNVGKSSMINTLMNRKNYARVSKNPGKTATINFYNIDSVIYFVDLPGYGYANVSLAVKEKWGRMIERYLKKSPALVAVFLLVDIRHSAGDNDRQMYQWIVNSGYEPIIILTKADKIKRSQVNKHKKIIIDSLGCPENTVMIPFSSATGQGKEEILDVVGDILSTLEPAKIL